MSDAPDKRQDSAQSGVERPSEPAREQRERFNPFVHEDDMFKVVLWTGGIVLAIILLVVLVRGVL